MWASPTTYASSLSRTRRVFPSSSSDTTVSRRGGGGARCSGTGRGDCRRAGGGGRRVDLRVDAALRRRTQATHTATHPLRAALRKIVRPHVKQAGSSVGPDKLRFDFTHFEAVPDDALREVEDFANEAVFSDRPVSWELLPYQEAIERGAMAFFGEKYADVVRMVTVPGVSRELCGGTHVRRPGEIALFPIVAEGGVGAGGRGLAA